MQIYEIDITPIAKPRMTRSDAWKARKCVLRYWEYKDELKRLTSHFNTQFEDGVLGVSLVLPMPKSWSKKKKAEMDGKPHQQKPDLDNILKGLKDCLLDEDKHIWKYEPAPYKVWGYEGKIVFYI